MAFLSCFPHTGVEMDGRDILGCTAENTPSVFRGHCCCCCFLPPRPTYPQLGHCLWVGGKLYTRQSEGTQSASSLIQSRASLVPRIVPDSWSALWGCLSILLCFFFFFSYYDYLQRVFSLFCTPSTVSSVLIQAHHGFVFVESRTLPPVVVIAGRCVLPPCGYRCQVECVLA